VVDPLDAPSSSTGTRKVIDRIIRRTVDRAVKETIGQKITEAVDRAIESNPRIQFIKTMQMQMLSCDPKMDPREAWRAAVEALKSFCEDERCEFGDPRFDWSRDGAVTVIHEYEIHHWEPAP
jgi:hypothetical protein